MGGRLSVERAAARNVASSLIGLMKRDHSLKNTCIQLQPERKYSTTVHCGKRRMSGSAEMHRLASRSGGGRTAHGIALGPRSQDAGAGARSRTRVPARARATEDPTKS